LTEDEADDTRDRITGIDRPEDLEDCDIVIEAALEDLAVKRDIFADLDLICRRRRPSRRTRARSRSP